MTTIPTWIDIDAIAPPEFHDELVALRDELVSLIVLAPTLPVRISNALQEAARLTQPDVLGADVDNPDGSSFAYSIIGAADLFTIACAFGRLLVDAAEKSDTKELCLSFNDEEVLRRAAADHRDSDLDVDELMNDLDPTKRAEILREFIAASDAAREAGTR